MSLDKPHDRNSWRLEAEDAQSHFIAFVAGMIAMHVSQMGSVFTAQSERQQAPAPVVTTFHEHPAERQVDTVGYDGANH
jgi:hypothetical protein